jgi:Uma2 family endonuclease
MSMTVEEFLAHSLPDATAELVRGELRVTPPAGGPHGAAAANLLGMLWSHVKARGLGRVFSDATGYELVDLPRTVRAPDVSFVRIDRLPANGIEPGLLRLAPDLAVEVLSPSETASQLEEKLHDYLTSGTSLIWVADPVRLTVMVVPADSPVRWLRENDLLEGQPVVPGFTCRVSEIFEGIARDA